MPAPISEPTPRFGVSVSFQRVPLSVSFVKSMLAAPMYEVS